MFGVSILELVVILTVALLVFGPEKLPEIARMLGKVSGDLKRNADAVRREFYNTVYVPSKESPPRLEEKKRDLVSTVSESLPAESPATPLAGSTSTPTESREQKNDSDIPA